MATFEVLIEQVENIRDHPYADRLSIFNIRDFICISAKLEDGSHRYENGHPVAYIPEGSIVPEWLLREIDMWDDAKNIGRLDGKGGDRVKARRLRNVLSQGLVYPCCGITSEDGTHYRKWMKMKDGEIHKVGVGWNVAEELGITKWEPEIPASMSGEVVGHSFDLIYKFDVENGQKFNTVFAPTDLVNITEKIHGTFCGFILTREYRDDFMEIPTKNGSIFATAYSKGIGSNGLVFKAVGDNKVKNIYIRALSWIMNSIPDLDEFFELVVNPNTHVVIMGELFGVCIQDLGYSTKPTFRAFDIALGNTLVGYDEFVKLTSTFHIDRVPLLYRGEFQNADLPSLRDGKSSVDNQTLKEGIVIRDDNNGSNPSIGRKMVKMVSPDYLTRKGSATEYQ